MTYSTHTERYYDRLDLLHQHRLTPTLWRKKTGEIRSYWSVLVDENYWKISPKHLARSIEYISDLLCFIRPLTLLQAQIPAIVKATHKQLREKSFKTRQVKISRLQESWLADFAVMGLCPYNLIKKHFGIISRRMWRWSFVRYTRINSKHLVIIFWLPKNISSRQSCLWGHQIKSNGI